ncbi:hypothetical protein F511_12746 [Dorcoceras hygrometricum]|uniref:Ubiquitin-like protease family profile domain-containing protein n=1 Tax=Dorcoceras hygrometricum TaxID=472368 RepID=A0A2Z7BRC3_9LAMI|nr:hypothetical protein F511_12746 [Dorcoceras hygrometricum]
MVKRKDTSAVDIELQERTFGTNHVMWVVNLLSGCVGLDGMGRDSVVCCGSRLCRLLWSRICRLLWVAMILVYEVYNGVGEAFATRREDADVSLPRMCHWVTRKWHKNHAPSFSDVAAAFSSSRCEDVCGMLTPTDADLLSAHYISGDFVVSNECAVTRHISELMSRGLKVVCIQRCLSPTPRITPPRSPSHASTPPRSPPDHSPPTRSPPHHSPPHRSPPHHSPPHSSPPHASPSRLQRLEKRMAVVEAQLTNMMDILKSLRSDMLSFKRARSPVIITGGMTASPMTTERTEETPSMDSPDGLKLTILDSDRSVDSDGRQLMKLIMPLARMMPHILMAMDVQTDTAIQWNIVRSSQFPKQSPSGECGVYAIAAAAFTLAEWNVYTLNDALVADFRKFCICSL